MSHQPVSVNAFKHTSLNAILLHLLLLPVLILSPNAVLNTWSEWCMQSISVVKLFGVCGYRAVNPPAAWICHVSERVVISRYIFSTAYFFSFYRWIPGEAFTTKCLLLRNHWQAEIQVCSCTQSMRPSFEIMMWDDWFHIINLKNIHIRAQFWSWSWNMTVLYIPVQTMPPSLQKK